MKHLAIAVAALLAAAFSAVAGEIEVRSAIEAVTVYPDGATVTRVFKVELPRGDSTLIARDFPLTIDPSSLRVEGESASRMVIGSIDARTPKPEPVGMTPELEKKIEALKDERAILDDRIAADTARKNFAQRFGTSVPLGLGEKAEARPLSDWRAAFVAVAEEITAADNNIRAARLKQRDVDRELAVLQSQQRGNPPRKMEVRVDLAADAATTATLRVTYTVRGARWLPIYDARLDTGTKDRKPALELVRRAEVVQQTGEDWANVALTVSTVRTAKGGNAPDLQPLIVRFQVPISAGPAGRMQDRVLSQRSAPTAPPVTAERGIADFDLALKKAEEGEAAADVGGFQAVFRIPGRVSVGASEGAKSFRIASSTPTPELLVRSTPALDDTAYLEATFKQGEDAPLLPGRISLYRDNIFVGRGVMALTPKDETVRLGFGADEKVKVTRTMVRRSEGTSGILTTSKTDEREFKITVRNGHDTAMKVTIEDQLPVSEITDIAVELLPVTTQPTQRDVRDRRGVLAWAFDAQAGEVKEIKLGWRLRWPADKTVFFDPRR